MYDDMLIQLLWTCEQVQIITLDDVKIYQL